MRMSLMRIRINLVTVIQQGRYRTSVADPIRIRIQHFLSMQIRIRIPIKGFDDKKLERIYSRKKIKFF